MSCLLHQTSSKYKNEKEKKENNDRNEWVKNEERQNKKYYIKFGINKNIYLSNEKIQCSKSNQICFLQHI